MAILNCTIQGNSLSSALQTVHGIITKETRTIRDAKYKAPKNTSWRNSLNQKVFLTESMNYERTFPKSYPTNLLNKDWSKRKCCYHVPAAEFVAKVHELEVRNDDVWIVTMPKSGTTWMQELVWLVMNDFDFTTAKNLDIDIRSTYLEGDFLLHKDINMAFREIESAKSPRLIKSHLPLPLLPAQSWEKRAKIIYVCRNPKDVVNSLYYNVQCLGYGMDMTLEEFIRHYIKNTSLTTLPFEHITEFYELRNEPWVYYTSYERMKSNLAEVIQDVCKFLNKSITEKQMQQMLKHLSFEEMSKNPNTNHIEYFEQIHNNLKGSFRNYNFIRKGKVGGHKEELSEELIKEIDQWIEESLSKLGYSLDELLLLEK